MAAGSGGGLAPQTPQRSLSIPGGYQSTPAQVQTQQQASTLFAPMAASLRQQTQPLTSGAAPTPAPSMPTSDLSPVERAAKVVNDALVAEGRFPDLESYITQGLSGEYEVPTNRAWQPFQQVKSYDLPQKIFEQANLSSTTMQMGLFAPLGFAWIALDNCLYLWDYTLPNPELIGWEENAAPITKVKLCTPKPGVFIKDITHVIAIATTNEMLLLGVANSKTPTGASNVALYNTRMSISLRGVGEVNAIECSTRSGRIFFTGSAGEDMYEFQYQQEEGWFSGKTRLICHTKSNVSLVGVNMSALGSLFSAQPPKKTINQLVLDDSRGLLYSLSDTSETKVWLVKNELSLALTRPLAALMRDAGHFSSRSELLNGSNVSIVSLSAIQAGEAGRMSLMATLNTGCRLYISLTRGYGMPADVNNAPTSMQILHIRFPPRDSNSPPPQTNVPGSSTAVQPYNGAGGDIDYQSRVLFKSRTSLRLPPGYFVDVVADPQNAKVERAFMSATDFARLKNSSDTSQLSSRNAEYAQWQQLPAEIQEIVSLTAEYKGAMASSTQSAGSGGASTLGFGNEMALQFDLPSAELAIMTRTGVTTHRRRRLVDTFAGLLRYGKLGAEDDNVDSDVMRFVRQYGRSETAATALAVACGQGVDVVDGERTSQVTDPEILEGARKVFIDHGGRAEYNANALVDQHSGALDSVRPSPRHDGLALYISRLVRSIWKRPVLSSGVDPATGPKVFSTVPVQKLKSVQQDLSKLSEFLSKNAPFIEGLAGASALGKIQTKQEETALQGEHRAMTSLVRLISAVGEGISFALVLFDERVEEILARLPNDESRNKAKSLTYEVLFVGASGRELAKELVKAIVNHNIAGGSNVDTVAETLRRRCGSFCSADDVVIFKAQEQVKRASEAGAQTETGRMLLNESERLFSKVAGSLSPEHLHWAIEQYVMMSFYAGAIQLCLSVAKERDRANRAWSWVRDGSPEGDERRSVFDKRKVCYELVFAVIQALDDATAREPRMDDGTTSPAIKRRQEAYDVINSSPDKVFQTCLYDWYMSTGEADRLLEIASPNVAEYLRHRSREDRGAAEMLWRYYAHHNDFLSAASVQLDLAQGYFPLGLEDRINYLGRAHANASTRQSSLLTTHQSRHQLLRQITDLMEVAQIQDDILQRIKSDPRLAGQRRDEVLAHLDGRILGLDDLFNQYADQADYHDICILIYQVADHRNPQDIRTTWNSFIEQCDTNGPALRGSGTPRWEYVGIEVQNLGKRLLASSLGGYDAVAFPIQTLLPMLERYAQRSTVESRPPAHWAMDIFLALDVPHETLLPILENLYYSNEAPFTGSKRKMVSSDMVYVMDHWREASDVKGERVVFGSEENAVMVRTVLESLIRDQSGIDAGTRGRAEQLLAVIGNALA